MRKTGKLCPCNQPLIPTPMKTSSPHLYPHPVFRKVCRRFLYPAAAALAVAAGGKSQAADKTWTNGAANSTWNTVSSNWSPSAWIAGDAAFFNAPGAGAISVAGTQTVGNITFGAAGYSFSGGTLQFNGAANTINTGANNVSITSGISFLAGGGINKTGTGKLTINSNITHVGTGQTIDNQGGILEIAGGNIHLTDVRLRGFTSGGSLDITGGTILLDGTSGSRGLVTGNAGHINITGGSVTTNSVIIGNGSSGNMTIGGSADVTVSGATTVLQVGAGNNAATGVLNLNGGTLTVYRIASGLGAGVGRVTTINLNGTTIKAAADNLNWINPFNDAGTNDSTSRINVLAGGAILDSNGNNVRIFRNFTGMAGDGGITKQGAGIVYLTGNNTVQGNTIVNAGTLLVGNTAGSATGTGNVTVKNNATFGGLGSITGSVTAEAGSTLIAGGVSSSNFSTTAVGTLTTGAQIWQDGAGLQLEFSTDGSTGSAGAEWDRYTLNGGLDLSAVTSGDKFTISLFTMSDATTRGALASWDADADAIWSGFLTTTTGITGFSADKFAFNTVGFDNTLNGSFSLVQNGNNLDLVYTAVPEPSIAALAFVAAGGLLFARRRRSEGESHR